MNETRIDWSDLHLFLAVARGGGLAGGAVTSGISPPTLGRHMVDLERALGEMLFHRQPRGYVLTTAGSELLIEAEMVEKQILAMERRRQNRGVSPPIHIMAGTWVTRFLTQHIQDIQISGQRLVFQAAESQHSINRREATIALRNARPVESGLFARKSTQVTFAAYATSTAEDHWIASTAQTPSSNWVRKHKGALIIHEVTNPRSLLDLARQGVGHVVLPCFVGDAEPDLIRSGPLIKELTHDQWLVVHGEDRKQDLVRRTVDRIAWLIVSNRALFEGRLR